MGQKDDPPSNGVADKPQRGGDEIEELEDELHALEGEGPPVEPPLLPSREPMRTIFKALGKLEQILGSLLLVMILVLVLAQVAIRYLPGSAAWTGELARLSMVWATFLMAGYLVAYPPHHIAIQVIDYVAKGRWLDVVKLFVNIVILLTCIVLIYGGYALVTTGVDQVTPAGELSMRFVNAIPLIGLVLVAIRAVLGIVVRDIPALRGRSREPA
jgi:TRAP-type C4-dicarboxylate transport system permease small subunit